MAIVGVQFLIPVLLLALAGCLVGLLRAPKRLLQRLGVPVEPTGVARRIAEERARTLLGQMLGEEGFSLLLRRGYLEIPSPSLPTRIYRVPYTQGMVEVFEAGIATMRLCVVPTRWVPDCDLVIMHKLLIEGDETRYLRVANRFPTATIRLLRPSMHGYLLPWEGD